MSTDTGGRKEGGRQISEKTILARAATAAAKALRWGTCLGFEEQQEGPCGWGRRSKGGKERRAER